MSALRTAPRVGPPEVYKSRKSILLHYPFFKNNSNVIKEQQKFRTPVHKRKKKKSYQNKTNFLLCLLISPVKSKWGLKSSALNTFMSFLTAQLEYLSNGVVTIN